MMRHGWRRISGVLALWIGNAVRAFNIGITRSGCARSSQRGRHGEIVKNILLIMIASVGQ